MARYDIRQVTRYVLVRKGASPSEPDADVSEFRRRDEAEAVLGALRGERAGCIKIGDLAIPLLGLDRLDTAGALDLLEARVQIASRAHLMRAKGRESWESKSAGRQARVAEDDRLRQAEANRIQSAYGSDAVRDC